MIFGVLLSSTFIFSSGCELFDVSTYTDSDGVTRYEGSEQRKRRLLWEDYNRRKAEEKEEK